MTDDKMTDNKPPPTRPTFLQIVMSTLAAAIGVQSNKNRERDFTGGNIYAYIAAGVIFTFVFVVVMILVVKLILKSSGL